MNPWIRQCALAASVAIPLAFLAVPPAIGQYMYLDSNGNGLHDAGDVVAASGPTTFDVWLDTMHNRDGSPAVVLSNGACEGTLPTIISYEIILHASGGTMNWSSATVTNQMGALPYRFGATSDTLDLYRGYGGGGSVPVPAGIHKLATISVTVRSGEPGITIAGGTPLSPWCFTSFGSDCTGVDYDFSLKLPSPDRGYMGDWSDVDGLVWGTPVPVPGMPVFTDAPTSASGMEGVPFSLSVTATDPDAGQTLTIASEIIPAAPWLMQTGGEAATPPVSATLSGTPGYTDAGDYLVYWTARDSGAPPQSCRIATTVSIADNDRPAVVSAPTVQSVDEGSLLTFTVSASDPDGGSPIPWAVSLPPGATLTTNPSWAFALFRWIPSYSQAGTYSVTFTVPNALNGGATTIITVNNTNQPPSLRAPTSANGYENSQIAFQVWGEDPDNDVVQIIATEMPRGAEFIGGGYNLGDFRWTPDFTQAGSHVARFAGNDGLGGTASAQTALLVANVDRPPVLTTPASVSGAEGVSLAFTLDASDPDGEAIDSLTASPLPPGATFATDALRISATFAWIPDFSQAGTYTVEIAARSACRPVGVSGPVHCASDVETVTLEIANTDRPPAVTAPEALSVDEGAPLTFSVTAGDADGEAIASLAAVGLPPGATFAVAPGAASGTFDWTPGFGQSGIYTVVFRAANLLPGEAATRITVRNLNRAPVAHPGGPYSGIAGIPVDFVGTGSSDPDGDALIYAWSLGDGQTATGATPSHVYLAGGRYVVDLTVTDTGDPALSASASTTADILQVFDARLFVSNQYRTIRLGTGRPDWCVHVEPVSGNFDPTDIVLPSIALRYEGGRIQSLPGKPYTLGDDDRNGATEVSVCFSKPDLRTLLAELPEGRNAVTVTLEGSLLEGARVTGSILVEVVTGGGDLAASLSPNPLRARGVLTFSTTRTGRVSASVYDLQGRRVRTLLAEMDLPSGYHDLWIDGTGDTGARLASGVYFYRIESAEGVAVGRFALMR